MASLPARDQYCPCCRALNYSTAQFCGRCGVSLAGAPAVAAVKTPTSAAEHAALSDAAKHDKFIGHTIDGRYRVDGLIGYGGMGAVIALITWSLTREKNPNDVAGRNQGGKSAANPIPPAGMVYVPGQEFTMGNNAGGEDERPQHKVVAQPFFIDLHEVTCAEYDKFLQATRRRPPTTWANGRYPHGWERRPVTGVTWDDANAYAGWVGKRLPTEEEWELAARGTDGRLYPWGNEWQEGLANAGPQSPGAVTDVGAHPTGASPFGALDMVGNAWEWTASDFVAYPGGRLYH